MFIVNNNQKKKNPVLLYITKSTSLWRLSDKKESQNNSGTNNFSLPSLLHNYEARGPTDSVKSVLWGEGNLK